MGGPGIKGGEHTGYRKGREADGIGNMVEKRNNYLSPFRNAEKGVEKTDCQGRANGHQKTHGMGQGRRRDNAAEHIADHTAPYAGHHRQHRNTEDIHAPVKAYNGTGKGKGYGA